MKEKMIFSQKLVNFLAKKGFRVIRTQPNKKMPWYDVYIFEDSEELSNAIEEYNNRK